MTLDIAESGSLGIDSVRWPDVARAPRSRLSAAMADALFRRAAGRLPVWLVYPAGAANPTMPSMAIHRPEPFTRRLGRCGLIRFGESYMAVGELVPPVLQRLRPLAGVRPPRTQLTSRAVASPRTTTCPTRSTTFSNRMWGLYLAYSQASFESGDLDVYQWTFAPTGGAR